MEDNIRTRPLWLKILHWVARIIALLFIVFILGMFIGEGGTWSQDKCGIPVCSGWVLSLIASIFGARVGRRSDK